MRHQTTELPIIDAIFPTGDTGVTVNIFDLTAGTQVGTDLALTEIGTTGIYRRVLVAGDLGGLPSAYNVYRYVVSNTNGARQSGKLIVHGYPEFIDEPVGDPKTVDAILADVIDAASLAADAVAEIQAAILSDATPFPGANVDAAVSSRAVAGDEMNLVDGAITAIKIAADALTAAKFATDSITADAIAADAVTELNAAVLAAIALLNDLAQSDILSDATPFPGANIDATISSRATQTSVDAIQNNTRFVGVVPERLKLPTSGTKDYKFFANLFDTAGSPEDPDSNTLNIRIEDVAGNVVVATTAMTRTGVGQYEYLYTINSTDQERVLNVIFEYDENAVSFQHIRVTEVVEFESTLDAIQTAVETDIPATLATMDGKLDTIDGIVDQILVDTGTDIPALIAALNDLSIADVQTALTTQGYTAARALLLDNLDVVLSTRATQASVDVIDGVVDAILVDTATNIPALIAALNDIAVTDILADSTPFDGADIPAMKTILDTIEDYHDNTTRFFDLLGTTEVTQDNAFFMVNYEDNGSTIKKVISFRDGGDNKVTLPNATRYINQGTQLP